LQAGAVTHFDVERLFATAHRTMKDTGSQCSILSKVSPLNAEPQ